MARRARPPEAVLDLGAVALRDRLAAGALKAVDLAEAAIARIERGRVSPRLDTLAELLEATGMTLEVAPHAGAGVDRSLIRASLARTPEERIRAAGLAARNLAAFRDEVARGSAR